MAVIDDRIGQARLKVVAAIDEYAAVLRGVDGAALGEGLIQARELKDRVEAVFAEGLSRFDKTGAYRNDGAIDPVAWLRSRCKVSGSEASQRLGIARQLEHLPQTQRAFANGTLGLQQVAVMAQAVDHIGAAAVTRAESHLIGMAERLDAGQFTGVVKSYEHQVDAQAALAEANRAHERRYLHVLDRPDGLVKLDGLLDKEGGAIVRNAINAQMLPGKGDARTPAQRRADALVETCRGNGAGRHNGSSPRPLLVVRTTVETLAGLPNAPAGEIEGGGMVPSETVQRLACDTAITRITGKGELEGEITRASRTTPAATRRALDERDRGCVAEHCTRPVPWTDAHHLQHWAQGGPTILSNLILLCRTHHRMVHEEGWQLQKLTTGRWALLPPMPSSRSA